MISQKSTDINIKICGLTRLEDALVAENLGAWALGFIFYKNSPRAVDLKAASSMIHRLNSLVKKVGVVVNLDFKELKKILETGIDTLQFHGNETSEYLEQVRVEFPKTKLIKVFRLQIKSEVSEIRSFNFVNYLLMDSFVPGQLGGTGEVSRWDLANASKKYGKVILSGGLNAQNVKLAIKEVAPWGIDVSSGVEISPGIKSKEKLIGFFNTVRSHE
jgi:phosphoribosylanthranilate isomerase